MRRLQDFLVDIDFEALPPAWRDFDLVTFSRHKSLFDYQQEALRFALRGLWKYYQDCVDYQPGEPDSTNDRRKDSLWQWYQTNGLTDDLAIALDRQRREMRDLLSHYYRIENGRISYKHFINRLGFWMATGSGKTLIIVKLLELLWRLGLVGEIPRHNILVLAHSDHLLQQLRTHVDEFNATRYDLFIRLRDLREYPEARWETGTLFRDHEVTVFYYRSDNLSDEQKERIIDFRSYDDNGRWFILLDEAHKGDKEESKRQHIYSIMSRNGFLFNFSATFIDPRDIATTAYNFNLSRFIESGYGKHIVILKQENRAFREGEDYSGDEKQKIVLKALLLLTYVRSVAESLADQAGYPCIYHKPLLLALVHTVNKEDADLKLFFREIERIGRGDIAEETWQAAKIELWAELEGRPDLVFENEKFIADLSRIKALSRQDLWRAVYNADAPGEIEVWLRPSDRKEMAFKLKSAERPFALVKIGDIGPWLKSELEGYDVLEGITDESFFERLNDPESDIMLLMGSRAFYEGWDSKRPNVIMFINLGTSTEARKFILQSIGRGVRLEPLAGYRKRLRNLYNAGLAEASRLYPRLQDQVMPIETLFLMGTKRRVLQTVVEELDHEREDFRPLALAVNQEAVDDHLLLVPIYRSAGRPLWEQRALRKFEIAADELARLQQYVRYLGDDRLLMVRHGAAPQQVRLLHRSLQAPHQFFNTDTGRRYGRLDLALGRLFGYFQVVPEEVSAFKPLADEIEHYRQIQVSVQKIGLLQEAIRRVREEHPRRLAELRERYETGRLRFEDLLNEARRIPEVEVLPLNGSRVCIKHVEKHYYTPVIWSENERANHIRHIIQHPSEVKFIEQLEAYVSGDGLHRTFDWWVFSKIDETCDAVFIPYYDPEVNRILRFKPDFIFWLQRGEDYFIVFVDPKGRSHTDYEHKVDGYRMLFEDESGNPRVFMYSGLKVRVYLRLHTEDRNRLAAGYQAYWFDHPEALFSLATGHCSQSSPGAQRQVVGDQ